MRLMLMIEAAAFIVLATMPLDTGTFSVFAGNAQLNSKNDILNQTTESKITTGSEGVSESIGDDGYRYYLEGNDRNQEIYAADGGKAQEIKDSTDDVLLRPQDNGKEVYGDSDNNTIEVGGDDPQANDFYFIYGKDGSDYIKASTSSYINGGIGDDTIYCAGYECDVNGDEGNDEIHVQLYDVGSSASGGSGNDKVFGKGYSVSGDQGNDYLSPDMAVYLKGGEGNDVLEVLSPSWESYYNGGAGADIFNCSPGPGDVVEDYNPEEGDTVSADCETAESDNSDTIY